MINDIYIDIEQKAEDLQSGTTTFISKVAISSIYSSRDNSLVDEKPLRASYIIRDPNICNNKPILRGTRIAVSNIVELYVVLKWDIQKIRDEYPYLTHEQVIAALEYYEQHTSEIDKYLKEETENEDR